MAQVDILSKLMDVAARCPHTVQRGATSGGGKVSVASAPHNAWMHLDPQLSGRFEEAIYVESWR